MRLITQSKDFQIELMEVKATIERFKDNYNPKGFTDYNNQIDSLKEKMRVMTETGREINKKQIDLEFTEEQFPVLDQCKVQIKPFEEFWKTYAQIVKNEESWLQTAVADLDAGEIQAQFKKLNSTINRLEQIFSTAKNKALTRLA